MKDFLGQELNIGDRVIFPDAYGYDGFTWGIVEKFTPKNVLISYTHSRSGKTETKLKKTTSVLLMGEEQQKALVLKTLLS